MRSKATDTSVIEEAAMWVARLGSSDATSDDHVEFETWMRSNPEHAAAYEEMSVLWGDLARVPRSVGRRPANVSRSVAAVLVAGLALYGAEKTGIIDRLRSDYYTSIGEVRTVALSDGSHLTLNTDTAVQVVLSKNERRIVMLRGEAFFDVAPDATRPFVVEGYQSDATAVGTHYAVKVDVDDNVAVVEGHVAVSSSRRRVMLTAGQTARIGDGGDIAAGSEDVAALTSWKDRKLTFSGRRLADVVNELGRYQRGAIVVLGSELRDLKVSGTFETADVQQSIASLQDIVPIVVDRVPGVITIIRTK